MWHCLLHSKSTLLSIRTHNPPDFGQRVLDSDPQLTWLVREYWTVTHNSPDFGQRVLDSDPQLTWLWSESTGQWPTTHLTLVREYWTVTHNPPDFGQRVLDSDPQLIWLWSESTGQCPTTHLTLVREYWTLVRTRSHSVEAPAGCSVGRLPTLSVIWSSSMMVTSTSRSRLIWKASLMDPSSPLLLNSTMASVRLGHFLAPGKNNNQKAIKGNSHWSSKTVN